MSAFNDYCMVCDRQCTLNSAYCSDACRLQDSPQVFSTPALETVSPLLGPGSASPMCHRDLSYESPFLGSSHHHHNDLDIKKLDLNHSALSEPRRNGSGLISDYISSGTVNYQNWLKMATIQ